MFSFRQPVEGVHNDTVGVLQQLPPQVCLGEGETICASTPRPLDITTIPVLHPHPNLPITCLRRFLICFIFLLFLKYSHRPFLWENKEH